MSSTKTTTIVRRPDFAGGGITEAEREALAAHTASWIATALRTEPIVPARIVPAIEALYRAAGLTPPPPSRIIVVPSPLVMALAGGLSAVWWRRWGKQTRAATYAVTVAPTTDATFAATDVATRDATRAATDEATFAATDVATRDATRAATAAATDAATDAATVAATTAATDAATDVATFAATDAATVAATDAATFAATTAATDVATRAATDAATRAATRDATRAATRVATDAATRDATEWDWLQDLAEAVTPGQWPAAAKAITDWWQATQGGNHWVAWDCYLTAARDILGLRLPAHAAYAAWERCAREGSWRYLHPEFCLVSDFPEVLRQDDQHRPHCAEGPSHRWRDGWSLYHWHGVRVEPWVIETPADQLTVAQVHTEPNAEVRRVLMTRMGWARYLAESGATYVQADDYGWLYEIPLDGDRTMRVVRVINGTPEPEGADQTGCEPGRDGRWYKVYWLRVPSRCQTAREAVAWTNWCDDPSQYEEVVRT